MTIQDASALATRLAERIDKHLFDQWVTKGADDAKAALSAAFIPLLQAQAEEDEKQYIEHSAGMENLMREHEEERKALRALVGSMKGKLGEMARQKRLNEMDIDEMESADWHYAYDRLVETAREAIEEADKVAN